jgi:hypothetical protein
LESVDVRKILDTQVRTNYKSAKKSDVCTKGKTMLRPLEVMQIKLHLLEERLQAKAFWSNLVKYFSVPDPKPQQKRAAYLHPRFGQDLPRPISL